MPDVNVLVVAHRTDSPGHPEYLRALARIVEGSEPYALSPLVLSGFLRVVTNPAIMELPTPLDEALEFVDSLTDRPEARLLQPGLEHWSIFLRLVRQTRATGNLLPDAYHAALALEHGCEWVTADGGFHRVPGLRVVHPLSLA